MEHETIRRHRRNLPRQAGRFHKTAVALGALVLAGAIGWGVAQAATTEVAPMPGDHNCREMHGKEFGGPMKHMARELDLTEEQRNQIHAIFRASREDGKALRQQMHAMRSELQELIATGSYSEEQARAIAGQRSQAFVDMAVLRARTMNEVRAVLTPEQQAKARDLMDAHDHGPGAHRHPGMPFMGEDDRT